MSPLALARRVRPMQGSVRECQGCDRQGPSEGYRGWKPLRFSLCGHRHVQGECQKVVRNRNNSSKKLFLSYWTGVKIDDFYLSLSGEVLNEDRPLLERIASGDVKALGILYFPYARRVRDFATACFRTSRWRRT